MLYNQTFVFVQDLEQIKCEIYCFILIHLLINY